MLLSIITVAFRATEKKIQPNLLRNWKKEFLNNASAVFDDKREENLKEKLAEERREKAEYAKKVGRITTATLPRAVDISISNLQMRTVETISTGNFPYMTRKRICCRR